MAYSQEPANSPAGDEAALRARVDQYYKLMVDKKFREAEKLVADESKDDYYNSSKPDIRGFEIQKLEFRDSTKTTATVTIKAKVMLLFMGAGAQIFEMPTPTYWKVDGGEWRWYVPEEIKSATPFGSMKLDKDGNATLDSMQGKAPGSIQAPDFAAMQNQISIDRTELKFTSANKTQTVTISNQLPGPVDLRIDPHAFRINGITPHFDSLRIEKDGSVKVAFEWNGSDKVADTVQIVAMPLNRSFDVHLVAQP
jgi:hypothetical protein